MLDDTRKRLSDNNICLYINIICRRQRKIIIYLMPFTEWPFTFRRVYEETMYQAFLVAWVVLYSIPYTARFDGVSTDQGPWHAEVYELLNQDVDMRLTGHDNTWSESFHLNVTEIHISAGKFVSSKIYIYENMCARSKYLGRNIYLHPQIPYRGV